MDDALEDRYRELREQFEALSATVASDRSLVKLAIFDQIPMPVWACDRDCTIVFWNKAAERLYCHSEAEALGKDFVELFVNKAEQDKARQDCRDIIDNNRQIRNMADDIDKHGNTKTLVTQCFAIYDVGEHKGLQVEISYEVKDIDRLELELHEVQSKYRREVEQREALERQFVEATRQRAVAALASVVQASKDGLRERENVVRQMELSKSRDQIALEQTKRKIKTEREKLLAWEKDRRKRIHQDLSIDDLNLLIDDIENLVDLDV